MTFKLQSSPTCNSTFYNPLVELRKYTLQSGLLSFSLLLHFRLIWIIRGIYLKTLRLNSFYTLYLLECILNSLSIIALILLDKPSTYLNFMCSLLTEHFPAPTYFLNVFWICDYVQLANYCIIFTLVAPFSVIWTVIFTKGFLVDYYGGVAITYIHLFPWARLSVFKGVFFIIIFVSVLVSSTVTVYCLLKLNANTEGSERNLCIATVISTLEVVGFLSVELCFIFAPFLRGIEEIYDRLMQLQSFVYDMVLFLDPIVMLQMNKKMRSEVLGRRLSDGFKKALPRQFASRTLVIKSRGKRVAAISNNNIDRIFFKRVV